jgi:PST family polysaccharide transporter
LLFGAPLIVRIALGSGFAATIPILRILSLLPPLVATSSVYGIQWMLAMRLDNLFNRIVVITGVANVLVALLVAPRYGHIGMAVTAVLADIAVAAGIFTSLTASRKAPWQHNMKVGSSAGAACD